MSLTDVQIRKEKPGDKPRKLADSGGLYPLGVYPEVSLAEAREAHQAGRKLLAGGTLSAHQ
jgi:hypothetical protein